jgi:predicted N-acetyltransferase YhbS
MLTFHIRRQTPADAAAIEPLLDRCFGPERRQRTVYRLRDGIRPVPELCFAAVDDSDQLLASLQFWPIRIESTPAILLGPLAVKPKMRNQGLGRALVRHGINEARRNGHRLCVVSGPPEYYRPYGFVPAVPRGLVMPGPLEPERLQVLELVPGALDGVRGLIQPDERYARAGDADAGTRQARA